MSNNKNQKFRESQKVELGKGKRKETYPTLKDIYTKVYNRNLTEFLNYILGDPFAVFDKTLRSGFVIPPDKEESIDGRDDWNLKLI